MMEWKMLNYKDVIEIKMLLGNGIIIIIIDLLY